MNHTVNFHWFWRNIKCPSPPHPSPPKNYPKCPPFSTVSPSKMSMSIVAVHSPGHKLLEPHHQKGLVEMAVEKPVLQNGPGQEPVPRNGESGGIREPRFCAGLDQIPNQNHPRNSKWNIINNRNSEMQNSQHFILFLDSPDYTMHKFTCDLFDTFKKYYTVHNICGYYA